MIFVTLGTQDKSFSRLLEAIEDKIKAGKIKDKVIVQAGYTKFQSKYMEVFDLVPIDKFNEYVEKCDVLITHGGVGSILTGLTNNKKVIATPRLSKYKEHTNDHQVQIVSEFAKRGYILEVLDLDKIDEVIKEAKKFKPKKYKSNNDNMKKLITDYIDDNDNVSLLNKVSKLITHGFIGPINFISMFLFFVIFYKIGFNLIVDIIVSSLIVVFINYFVYKDDFTNTVRVKYFLARFFTIALDIFVFMYLLNFNGIYMAKFLSLLFNTLVSLIIAYVLRRD